MMKLLLFGFKKTVRMFTELMRMLSQYLFSIFHLKKNVIKILKPIFTLFLSFFSSFFPLFLLFSFLLPSFLPYFLPSFYSAHIFEVSYTKLCIIYILPRLWPLKGCNLGYDRHMHRQMQMLSNINMLLETRNVPLVLRNLPLMMAANL